MLKLSTKKLLFLLAITCVSVSATNKELYEVNNKNEKKYTKNTMQYQEIRKQFLIIWQVI